MARLLRWLVIGASVVVILPALLLLLGLITLQVPAVQRALGGMIADAASQPGREVAVGGLKVRWPLDVTIARLQVADRQGVWMATQDMRLDWSPSRLLAGVLDIDDLVFGRVTMLRRPVEGDAGIDRPGGARLPRLPLALRIDRLSADLALSDSVLGHPASVRVDGRAAVSGEAAVVNLRAKQSDGAAVLDAGLSYDGGSGRMTVDVAADQAAVGLIASLMEITGLPPLAIRIEGSGPVADWQGRLTAASGARTCAAVDIQAARGMALEVAIDGGFDSDCFDYQALRTLAPDGVAIEAALAWTGNRLHIGRARMMGAVGRVAVEGAIVAGVAEDLKFEVEIEELSRVGELAGLALNGRAAVIGGIEGPLGSPVIRARVASASGSLAAVGWSGLDGGVSIFAPEGGRGWLVASDGRLTVDLPQAAVPVGETFWRLGGEVDLNRARARIATLQIDTGAFRFAALGTVEEWGKSLALHVDMRGEDLAVALKPLGLAVDGRAVIQAEVVGSLEHPLIVAEGRLVDAATRVARLDALLGPRPHFRAVAAARSPGVPFAAVVEAPNVSLTAGGLSAPTASVGWRAEFSDLSKMGVAAASASAAGWVAGGSGRLAAGAVVEATELPGGPAGPLRARLVLGTADVTTTPRIAVRGTVDGRAVHADGRAEVAVGDKIRISQLQVTSGEDRLSGEFVYEPTTGRIDGVVNGRLASLAPWSELAGVPLAGSAIVELRLTGDDTQAGVLTVQARDLALYGTTAARLSVNAEVASLFGEPKGAVRIAASEVARGGIRLAGVNVAVDGDARQMDFDVRAAGEARAPLSMDASGHASIAGRQRTVDVNAFRIQYGGRSARLGGPSRMVWTEDAVRIAPTAVVVGDGRVELAGAWSGDTVEGQARLSSVPVDLLELVRPDRDLTGTVSGEVRVAGNLRTPEVNASLTGRNLGMPSADGPATLVDAELLGRWSEGRLEARISATSGDRVAARADASFPLLLTPDGLDTPEGPIEGRVRLNADLGGVADLLPLVGQRMDGQIRADVGIAGTVERPAVTGQASLATGRYDHYLLGVSLRNVSLTATADDPRNFRVVGSASDGRGGRIAMQGQITVEPTGVAYLLNGNLTDFTAVRLDTATAQASGALRLEGSDWEGALTGALAVGPVEVDLGERGPANVVTLDVVEVNRPGGDRPSRQEQVRRRGPVEGPFRLALSVEADVTRLFVRGRGLDSEWRGQLVAGGTASDPELVGQLEVVRGRYDLFGRNFTLTEGEIVFDGGDRLNPQIGMVAQAKARDIVARVNVDGTVREPKIEFSSEPPYPSDEILARLLFGKEAGKLTVGQQVQLARAAAGLTGRGGGFDPIGNLRGALGLDVLEIGTEEGGEGDLGPTVSAGKYLDEETFLRLEEGARGGRVAIERDLGGGFSVETELGEQAGGGVGLNWRKDY